MYFNKLEKITEKCKVVMFKIRKKNTIDFV